MSKERPMSATPYQHVCPEVDCIYYGKPTNGGMCGCHRTREQVMLARIEALEAALREIARQMLLPELIEEFGEEYAGDFEGAYEALIGIARAALAMNSQER